MLVGAGLTGGCVLIVGGPNIGGRTKNGLNEIDAEEAEEVDERRNEGEDGDDLGQVQDVERGGVTDLLTPPGEQEVDHGEEEGEEHRIGYVKRERQSVGCFGLLLNPIVHDSSHFHVLDRCEGFGRRSPAHIHREKGGENWVGAVIDCWKRRGESDGGGEVGFDC